MKNSWKTLAVLCCLALIEAAAQVAVGPLDNGTVSATLFAGSDQGAQVNAALTASSNLKVSAEGFTGTLNSASNPIPGGQRGEAGARMQSGLADEGILGISIRVCDGGLRLERGERAEYRHRDPRGNGVSDHDSDAHRMHRGLGDMRQRDHGSVRYYDSLASF